ncbi:hypothetical protein PR048_014821 [Dryococelus australis]|uniref:Uncharacterized protein n=1 Tax=Dryococelus australis TaxID=614101 RepID=A0ABQ9HFG4_9NEOP|nr:hypothetical protein PR048_014821 [Dryococelus australis]
MCLRRKRLEPVHLDPCCRRLRLLAYRYTSLVAILKRFGVWSRDEPRAGLYRRVVTAFRREMAHIDESLMQPMVFPVCLIAGNEPWTTSVTTAIGCSRRAGTKGQVTREIPEKTRRPTALSGTIRVLQNEPWPPSLLRVFLSCHLAWYDQRPAHQFGVLSFATMGHLMRVLISSLSPSFLMSLKSRKYLQRGPINGKRCSKKKHEYSIYRCQNSSRKKRRPPQTPDVTFSPWFSCATPLRALSSLLILEENIPLCTKISNNSGTTAVSAWRKQPHQRRFPPLHPPPPLFRPFTTPRSRRDYTTSAAARNFVSVLLKAIHSLSPRSPPTSRLHGAIKHVISVIAELEGPTHLVAAVNAAVVSNSQDVQRGISRPASTRHRFMAAALSWCNTYNIAIARYRITLLGLSHLALRPEAVVHGGRHSWSLEGFITSGTPCCSISALYGAIWSHYWLVAGVPVLLRERTIVSPTQPQQVSECSVGAAASKVRNWCGWLRRSSSLAAARAVNVGGAGGGGVACVPRGLRQESVQRRSPPPPFNTFVLGRGKRLVGRGIFILDKVGWRKRGRTDVGYEAAGGRRDDHCFGVHVGRIVPQTATRTGRDLRRKAWGVYQGPFIQFDVQPLGKNIQERLIEVSWLTTRTTLPPPKRTGVRFPTGSLPDFRTWKSCRMMPLVGRFSRGYSVFPILALLKSRLKHYRVTLRRTACDALLPESRLGVSPLARVVGRNVHECFILHAMQRDPNVSSAFKFTSGSVQPPRWRASKLLGMDRGHLGRLPRERVGLVMVSCGSLGENDRPKERVQNLKFQPGPFPRRTDKHTGHRTMGTQDEDIGEDQSIRGGERMGDRKAI